MYTVLASPTHVLPEDIQMPTQKDPIGGGEMALSRKWPRGLRRWEVTFPARRDRLDPAVGFFEHVQGDIPFDFDGAGMIEVVEPIIVAVVNGFDTEFPLPHRHIFVSSAVFYLNSALYTDWEPLGDGVIMDSIACGSAPAANGLLTAKYRRKARVIVETEELMRRERLFHSPDIKGSVISVSVLLQEIAND